MVKRTAQVIWAVIFGLGALVLIATLTGPVWMGLWELLD